jgi:hypothetical protein
MQEIICDLVELNALELDAVAGGFGYPFFFDFAVPQHYSTSIAIPEERFNGNGIGNGNFDAGNGNGNNNGNIYLI